MILEIERVAAVGLQQRYARLAGFLLVGVIVIAVGAGFIISQVAGCGTFAETAARVAASERLNRPGFSGDSIS